jgi:hypothetical protein
MPPRHTLFQTPDKKPQDAANNSLLSSLPLLWSCTSSGRPTSAYHYYGDDDSSDDASHHLYVKREYRSLHEMNDENSINRSSVRRNSSYHTSSNTISLNKQQPYPYHQFQQQKDGRVLTNKEASIFRQKKFQAPSSPSRSQATATTKTSSISTVQETLKQRLNTRYRSTNGSNIHRSTSKQKKDQQKQLAGQSMDLTTNTTRTNNETSTSSSLSLPQQISCNDDVSFLSFDFTENDCDDDDDDVDELLEPTVAVPSAEDVQYLQHCKQQVGDCFERYGMDHLQTANAFYELGQAHVRCEVCMFVCSDCLSICGVCVFASYSCCYLFLV